MLVLFLTNLVILVINCDSASVYKEPNKIEIIKDDVGTIVGSLNTFAFDILENILESPSEPNSNSTDVDTTNNNTIPKEKVRKVRSVAGDELLQLCQKHFKDQCAPKPTKEEVDEQAEIDDLREEVRQLMIVVDLLAEQEDIMKSTHVQRNLTLNQINPQGSEVPKLKSEELSEISQNLKTAVVELNDTRKLLDVERSRNRALEQAIKKQKEEIGKLKEALEEILSLNLTSTTHDGDGSESSQRHQRTRSSSDDSDVTRIEKLLKIKASEDDEVEKKLQDLEKQVARQKMVMRLKRLQESLAIGPNAEKDPLYIQLRKIFRKQPHQEGKGIDDDDEAVEIMTLEDLQEAFNNFKPKPEKAPLNEHDLVQKLLSAAQGLNVPKRPLTQSSGNWHPYLCMVDYDQDQRNSPNYGSSSGMQNVQFYGPPPELLINQFAMNRPQSTEFFHSNSNSGTKTYPQSTAYASYGSIFPNRPIMPTQYYQTSNTGAAKQIKTPHQNSFAKIFSPQSSYGSTEYHEPSKNVGLDPALDIRISPGRIVPNNYQPLGPSKPVMKSDQQHESTNYQPVYNSVPPATSATGAYPSGQQKPQFFPLRPTAGAQSAHPAAGSTGNPATYYYAPNSDGPSVRKADFGPEDAAGFGRFQKEMRQEVDRLHAIIRKLQKQRDEGKITGPLWKNRTTRSIPDDNSMDDDRQTLHKVVDLVGQALKEAEQNQFNQDGADPSRPLGDIEDSLNVLKNQLGTNNIQRSSSAQAGILQTPPHFPQFLPQFNPLQPELIKSPRPSKDDLFTDLVGKIMEKVVAAVPVVLQKLFHISVDELATYNGQDNELANILKNLGVFGYLPVIILRILSGLTSFVKVLKKNAFFRNFLMPALILTTVGGAIVFLIWWLQPDPSEIMDHQYQLQYQQYPQQSYQQYPPPSISYNAGNPGEYMGVESTSTPNVPIYNRDYYNN